MFIFLDVKANMLVSYFYYLNTKYIDDKTD